MVIDIITTPDVAIGWYKHHSRMLRDDKFNTFFDARQDMDKQLHSQFITHPFQIVPLTFNYWRGPTWIPFLPMLKRPSRCLISNGCPTMVPIQCKMNESSNPNSHRFSPYDKNTEKGRAMESFCDSKKPILCLFCGYTSHWAGNCSLTQSNCPE